MDEAGERLSSVPRAIETLQIASGSGGRGEDHVVRSRGHTKGLQCAFRRSPVTDAREPLFSKIVDGAVVLTTRVREAHSNGKGFLHGGVISTFADNAMGLSVVECLRREGVEPLNPGRPSVSR